MTTNSYPHVYLSPHYDDASLSCGGAIHQQTQAGQAALVVTICAAPPQPDEPLSAYAATMHRSWGNPADVVAMRQIEDQASLEILGAAYLRLNFNDCIYRGNPERGQWRYYSDTELFGPLHPDDVLLSHKIADVLREAIPNKAATVIYAPLSVGHHVDHQLAHTAAWELRRQGWNIVFYEDYPYSDPHSRLAAGWNQYSLTSTLAAKQAEHPLQPELHFFTEQDLQAKIASVRAYSSQVPMLFGSEAEMEQRLRSYALHVGEGQPAERVWVPG